MIDPSKDVDGFTPINAGLLSQGRAVLTPCTPSGVIALLQREGVAMGGSHAVIIGRSDIVGKPMAMLLLHQHATVTICHSRTKDLPALTRQADILVAAVGRTAYRVAQEGLTNARKHAPGAAVTLTVRAPDGDLQVEVRSLAPVAVAAAAPLPGAGLGLIGLAERVSLAGGTLEHGVDPDGAFVLRASLPR